MTPAPGATLYSDDFESASTWTLNPAGDDNAVAGTWSTGATQQTRFQDSILQPANAASGNRALMTGPAAGATVGTNDIDGGKTSIRSPLITLPADRGYQLSLDYYLAHLWNATAADYLRISLETRSGNRQLLLEQMGAARNRNAEWQAFSADLSAWAGQSIYLLIEAADGGAGSIVEAGVDKLRITYQ
ncbi:MAG: hypothetical protein R3E89_10900 [Thiolinea sp.]